MDKVDRGGVAANLDLKTDSYRGYEDGVATGLVDVEDVPLWGGGLDTGG